MTDGRSGFMRGVPPAAKWLGLAGLIPFAAAAAAVWIIGSEHRSLATEALIAYGAAILSFMGGCRWGFGAAGLGNGASWANLAISVLPALWAWGAVLAGAPSAFSMLALGFALLLVADLALARSAGAPAWWPALRWPLSLGAIAALMIAGMA
jgi:hypothetical protein